MAVLKRLKNQLGLDFLWTHWSPIHEYIFKYIPSCSTGFSLGKTPYALGWTDQADFMAWLVVYLTPLKNDGVRQLALIIYIYILYIFPIYIYNIIYIYGKSLKIPWFQSPCRAQLFFSEIFLREMGRWYPMIDPAYGKRVQFANLKMAQSK